MARHAAVDLSLIFKTLAATSRGGSPAGGKKNQLRQALREAGLELHDDAEVAAKLAQLRAYVEPFVNTAGPAIPPVAAADHSRMENRSDNWQRAPGMRRSPGDPEPADHRRCR